MMASTLAAVREGSIGRLCSNCGTNSTPMWRRSPTGSTVCNACGIYLKAHKANSSRHRNSIKSPEIEPTIQCPPDTTLTPMNDVMLSGICHNCGTTATPLWRRDENDKSICNACGLFLKSHRYHRPRSIWTTIIKRRNRAVPTEFQPSTIAIPQTPNLPVHEAIPMEYSNSPQSYESYYTNTVAASSPAQSTNSSDSDGTRFSHHEYMQFNRRESLPVQPYADADYSGVSSGWGGSDKIDESGSTRIPSIKFLLN